jgi:hypothetical protein
VIAVGAEPIGDRLTDARTASCDDGVLHLRASSLTVVQESKNTASDYENRTLGSDDLARCEADSVASNEPRNDPVNPHD